MAHPVLLVVDAANVVGSRPDGWWRDRAGATARLRDELAGVVHAGLPGLPAPVEVALVVEGQARSIGPAAGVRVVVAPGSGDDAIVALLESAASEAAAAGATSSRATGDAAEPGRVVVVTADRELRERVAALGAEVRGPGWLRRALPPRPKETARPKSPEGPKSPGVPKSPGGMSPPQPDKL